MPPQRRDLLLLTALCALLYATGLTTHGLTNWQESQRLIVAREMQSRGDWLIPTINNRPYLAKPPLIYWGQLALATLTGHQTGLFELRLLVALAGLVGVLCTYLAARRLLESTGPPPTRDGRGDPRAWARDAALWSALCLATGTLYVRSSRIGELDILLVPFTVTAIAAIAAAWKTHRDHNRTNFPAVAVATIAAIGAGLTKGPPGIIVIALAGYGGMALWHLAAVRPRPLWSCFIAYSRTHPVLVLGAPLATIWLWGRAVAARIGPDSASAFAVQEAEDNLRLFVPSAPITNLEAASYGVGLGSIAAIIAIIWLIRDRRRLHIASRPEWFIVLAWVGLGLAAFSILGKGVPRYLTPLWPGIAILGGMFLATAIAEAKRPQRLRAMLSAVIIALAVGQTAWYAIGRERYEADRSPRDLIAELLSPGPAGAKSLDHTNLATFEFRTPAIDFYAGGFVQPIGDINLRDSIAGATPWTLDDLRAHLRTTGQHIFVFVRTKDNSATDRLADSGLIVQTIPMQSRFTIDGGRTPVGVVMVSPRSATDSAQP